MTIPEAVGTAFGGEMLPHARDAGQTSGVWSALSGTSTCSTGVPFAVTVTADEVEATMPPDVHLLGGSVLAEGIPQPDDHIHLHQEVPARALPGGLSS